MVVIQLSKVSTAIAALAIGASLAGPAMAESSVLTDKAGMTVYTFDKDGAGKSACYGDCAAAWPPVMSSNLPPSADVGVVTREDGVKQAAYKGKPLYLFAGDRKPGDTAGDNVQNVWHVVAPSRVSNGSTTPNAAYSTGSSY